ncbi:transcriptional regulator [Thermohalobacter berrensis]|uniref:Transcriptional regulator n=1 Tax=Thermohalobacter berrensis TaxID=99594 RepID=A0A419TBD1_9FIRM|nr:transcriptional regulator [Thermohalobacter berrensis]
MQFTERQKRIINIVKKNEPITSEAIAKKLKLTRATLRTDLAILTMAGVLDARPKVGYFYSGKSTINYFAERISNIKVSEVKSLPVVVSEGTSVYDAIVTLFLEDVGTIFVTTEGLLSGVVSRKDFLKSAIGGTDINKIPVGVIMTRMPNIVVTEPDESVLDAAIKIIEHQVDSLPIVEKIKNENGEEGYKVIGRISKTNITRLFVDIANTE